MNSDARFRQLGVPIPALAVLFLLVIVSFPAASFTAGGLLSYLLIALGGAALGMILYLIPHGLGFLVLIPAFLLSILLAPSPALFLFPLYAVILGTLLSFLPRTLPDRTQILFLSAVVMGLVSLVLLAGQVIASCGTLSLDAVRSYFAEDTEFLRSYLTSLSVSYQGETVLLYDEKTVDLFLTLTLSLMPAFMIFLMSVVSFLGSRLFKRLFSLLGIRDELNSVCWPITMSRISAVIFFLSYMALIISGGNGTGVPAITSANLLLILMPAFSFVGFRSLIERIRSGKRRVFSIVLLVMTVLMFFLNIAFFFLLLSAVGSTDTFFRLPEPPSEGNDPDSSERG